MLVEVLIDHNLKRDLESIKLQKIKWLSPSFYFSNGKMHLKRCNVIEIMIQWQGLWNKIVIWKNGVIADPTHLVKLEQWSGADYNGLLYNFLLK